MAGWIFIVDDDIMNLKAAGSILSKNKKRVSAFKSGQAMLEYVRESVPDLILLDINMPGMDGFETLKLLREYEKNTHLEEIPVIFLTADDDISTENRGFEMGVSDYIRKPFDPDILVRRVDNILGKQEKILHFQEEATRDKLTGLYNKAAVNEKLTELCLNTSGCFMMIDLDSFKLVNDLHGHEMGDKILIAFSEIIRDALSSDSIAGRIGGDEFVAFSPSVKDEEQIREITEKINVSLVAKAKEYMGEDMDIPLGASIGAMFVAGMGSDFAEVFKLADKALYKVKQNGKHGYSIFRYDDGDEEDQLMNLRSISMILGERNISNSALLLNKEAFIQVYRFVMRYVLRYHKKACKLLFTLLPGKDAAGGGTDDIYDAFCEHVSDTLRKSDLVMRYRKNQIFVLLTEIKEEAVSQVVGNIIGSWEQEHGEVLSVTFELEFTESDE